MSLIVSETIAAVTIITDRIASPPGIDDLEKPLIDYLSNGPD